MGFFNDVGSFVGGTTTKETDNFTKYGFAGIFGGSEGAKAGYGVLGGVGKMFGSQTFPIAIAVVGGVVLLVVLTK